MKTQCFAHYFTKLLDLDLREFSAMVVYGFFFIVLVQILSIFAKEATEETSTLVRTFVKNKQKNLSS